MFNPDQSDIDGDGTGDACDSLINPPLISNVNPDSISRGNVAQLIISGEAFQDGITASLNSKKISIQSVVRTNSNELVINLNVPQLVKKGTYAITLTNLQGSQNSVTGYIVVTQ